jgi:anti-sigma regulatory factor (Ser/Thr protein kinase)
VRSCGPATLSVCPYNVATLPDTVIDAALATHPGLIRHGEASLNEAFVAPDVLVPDGMPTLERPDQHEAQEFPAAGISAAARFVEGRARVAGVPERNVRALTAAAAELALNAAVHAGGSVRVATWQEDGSFFCQVEDDGAGIGDPGGGYQPPFDGDQRWGLWQVRQAVELIEFGRSSRGSVVRLRVRRGADPDARAHPALTRL